MRNLLIYLPDKKMYKIILLFVLYELLWTAGEKQFVRQGAPFKLLCKSQAEVPNLALGMIESFSTKNCLDNCKFQNSVSCKKLLSITSNFSCETGMYCYQEEKCNFVFEAASIGLDGIRLACLDYDRIVTETEIQGQF